MAQIGNVALCAVATIILWTLIGLPIAMRVATPSLAWFLAPSLGWAVFSALTLPLFCILGMSKSLVIATVLAFAAAALLALRHQAGGPALSAAGIAAIAAAAVLALIPMAAILPKEAADGVKLAQPIFDHSKIAMIDEMVRAGVPAVNPFFNEAGAPQRLSYYYLWHYSAAVAAILTGVTGWEADAALTWFTAFSSLLVVIGFAIWLSGRGSAGVLAVALAATASLRPIARMAARRATGPCGDPMGDRLRRLAVPGVVGAAARCVGDAGGRGLLPDRAIAAAARSGAGVDPGGGCRGRLPKLGLGWRRRLRRCSNRDRR